MTQRITTTCDYPGCQATTDLPLGSNSLGLAAVRILYSHGQEEEGNPQAVWHGYLCREHSAIVRRKLRDSFMDAQK